MNELRPVKTYSDLSTLSRNNQTKFRLDEINKIKDYFEFEIKERETMSKKLSKSVASVEYMDKILIILSARSARVSVISHLSVIGISAGIITSSFSLVFSLIAEVIKKLLKETRKRRKNIVKLLC